MLLSKRERMIGVITGVLLGVMAFYWIVYTPLSDRIKGLDDQISSSQDELHKDNILLSRKHSIEQTWSSMSRNAMLKDDSTAEARIQNTVREWAQDSGLALSLLRPERAPEKEGDFFYRVTMRVTGNGGMSQIGRFLYHIQTTGLPVRISDVAISSRKEGTDDLNVSLALATIYLAPETDKAHANQPAPPQTELQ